MKRLIILFSCLFISSLSYAANKMSMVTYFPVPYVAYSQVDVDQQLDVGLTTACNMNLGCSQSNANLKANTVNLKGGKLELNDGKGILGDSILLGSTNGTGKIQFKDVRIQRGDMQSVNADTVNVQTLNLFGKPFPSCKEKDGTGQMKWQKLKLQGYSGTDGELYLTCGKLADSEAEPEPEPEGECKLNWDICLDQGKDFDEEACRCYEDFIIDRNVMAFAFAGHPTHANGYKCLGEKNFTVAEKDNPVQERFPDKSKAERWYNWGDKISSGIGQGISVKTVRQMVYQCVFTKNVKIETLPANWLTMSTEERATLCKAKGRDTIFIRDDNNMNSSGVKAMQPRPMWGGEKGQFYCWDGLNGGASSSIGSRFPDWPCLGFISLDFYGCFNAKGRMFDGIADTKQAEWAPNESFRVLN